MRSLTSASSASVVELIVGTIAIATAHAHGKCGTSYSVTDIGTLGGLSAFAEGMNNRGELAGYSFRSEDFMPHAFVWSRKHGMRELKDLSTSSGSLASGINDRGHIAGTSRTQDGDFHAVVWRRTDGRPHDLGTLAPQGLISTFRNLIGRDDRR